MRKEQEIPPVAAAQIAAGAKIIQFARKAKTCERRPEIVDPLRRLEDEDEHRRTLQNLAAAVIMLALIAAGLLADRSSAQQRAHRSLPRSRPSQLPAEA